MANLNDSPQSEVDLLHVGLFGMKLEEEANFRARFLAVLMDSLPEMNVFDLLAVARFVDITKHDGVISCPAEAFILELVRDHFTDGLTPDVALARIDGKDGFRVNFDDAVADARRMIKAYPSLFSAPAIS